MKRLLSAFVLLAALSGCSDAPKGRWRVTAPVDVYSENNDGAPVAFVLQAGDICALGRDWSYQKMFRFKRVSCTRGDGWISIDENFVREPD
ncbi:membrane lipoprotein lipid attachment site-containing protein [Achromobacter sp.]|uniref:membrane lipoprotein lipid attachment site-containing protein n=1 Tax=Achromobacter sp. TaxID=134375 RepID=UPI003918FC85